ncbi:hypothetical protein HETIRDRAFT_107862 [Heterobasidion irregulare TC 32-1]|uniref:Uncharacterized protein n=1 Tax=Heterobasidion irregulare (strain TC 32-1) TaxID=747525 RepID=W4JYY9_HETIT|nr:uncharacterized protein HETIRDRAFT_107862 [Heterobasidion irregulare TC 32-1]ETW78280.1 hypothetical protein HETIRDRAFT_107862 [Heterobasidion irregulare TC 32-1]
MPLAKNGNMMASLQAPVTIAEKQDTGILTARHDAEAFNRLEETRRDAWVRQGEEAARLIWKEKTTHPLWETNGYHNLVLQWNVLTLPHPDDPERTMGNALCYLTDDGETEASVILLESEQCSEN